jgi:hypothetical protein
VGDTSIASVVVQVYDSKEKVVFYLSRRMLDTETRYHEMEKLCLCLFFTCTKLRHILLFAEIIIICKSDIIKHMLSAPVLKGRLRKWMFALSEFDIQYQPTKAVKGQALTDLIAERINTNITDYFIKWVEAIPMKTVTSKDVINFIKEHVIHRFGIPQTITTNGGSVYISEEFRKFAADVGIKLIRSSPYYAQANGQAEASN